MLERLVTGRLLLRPADTGDADAVFTYASDPEVSRYLPWKPHSSPEDTREFLQRWRARATCDVENLASARVLEKAGFALEGVLHRWDRHNVAATPRDVRVYARWRDG